jgi:hypothetical protein
LEVLAMEDVGIFYVWPFGIFRGHLAYFTTLLVYFKVTWYIFFVLVSCSKKNLATPHGFYSRFQNDCKQLSLFIGGPFLRLIKILNILKQIPVDFWMSSHAVFECKIFTKDVAKCQSSIFNTSSRVLKFSVRPSILLNNKECSPLVGTKGNFTPRG